MARGRQGDVQVDAHAEGELDDQHDQDGQIGLPQAGLAGFCLPLLRGWRGCRRCACHVLSPPVTGSVRHRAGARRRVPGDPGNHVAPSAHASPAGHAVTAGVTASGPAAHTDQARSTANRRHRSGTPLRLWLPRSAKPMPEPRTSVWTVLVTSTSLARARAATRAPTWTASPVTAWP